MRNCRWFIIGCGLLFSLLASACSDEGASSDKSCENGFAWEDGRCVPAKNCIDLSCADENRACVEAESSEHAYCSECRPGFVEDNAGACGPDENATCDDDPDHSIASICEGEHRDCVQPDQGPAHCAESCHSGFRLSDPADPASACVPVKTCDDIDEVCDIGCVAHEDKDAECVDTPCGDDEAFIPGAQAGQECVACNFEGLEGCTDQRIPIASGTDVCVCETQKGYFWNPNRVPAAGPELCDKDQDGWVDQRAASFFTDPDADPALKRAANCDFHIIDRFILQNDIPNAETREVTIAELTGGIATTVVLQESVRNDDPTTLQAAYNAGELPLLNEQQLPAGALNSLTKICADANADFNADGRRDLTEFQPTSPSGSSASAVFEQMSYFMMLAEGHFEPAQNPDEPGRYIITERTRGENLALNYPADAGDYWKTCTRFPDAIFSDRDVDKKVGTDFARYSSPPANHQITNPDQWRGMNHNSQFKCVNIMATEPTESADKGPHVQLLDKIKAPDSGYSVNHCRLTDTTPHTGDSPNPTRVSFDCAPVDPEEITQGVTWAAVDYIAGPASEGTGITQLTSNYDYERGCADMCEVWHAPACAGIEPLKANSGGRCFADAEDFGKRHCGCGLTYGGQDCEVGCPSLDMVMFDPNYNPTQRDGQYWMCGQVTTTHMAAPFQEVDDESGHGLRAHGIMPLGGFHAPTVLRSQNDCDEDDDNCTEYTVR